MRNLLHSGTPRTQCDDRYLYRIVFSMDGNFSLQKKTKQDDNDDTALCEGKGFFIPHSEMFASLVDRYGLPEGMSLPAEGPQESETTLAPGGPRREWEARRSRWGGGSRRKVEA